MKVIHGTKNFPGAVPHPVVTIGNFDGVHLGHQIIFKQVAELARKTQGTSVVLTFEPHPMKIVAPDRMPPMLTPFAKKKQLIEPCGIDYLICEKFDREYAEQSPRDFIRDILVERIGVKEIMIGFDYSFGKGGEGNVNTLWVKGEELGFRVKVIDPIKINNQLVSSSLVRGLIEKGKVEEAAEYLGRPYSLIGPVVKGFSEGENMGFPTANIEPGDVLIPARGVYAVKIRHHDGRYKGVANIGVNPTFNRNRLSIEVHIFDFNQRIYDNEIEISFVNRIRDEIQYQSAGDLIKQIEKDVTTAKNLLAELPTT